MTKRTNFFTRGELQAAAVVKDVNALVFLDGGLFLVKELFVTHSMLLKFDKSVSSFQKLFAFYDATTKTGNRLDNNNNNNSNKQTKQPLQLSLA